MKLALCTIILIGSLPAISQEIFVQNTFVDGIIICGYVDNGAYLNFTGPNVQISFNNSKFMFGMLPSLRFRNDRETPRNAFITPNLGIGLTYLYKNLAIQIPCYYNAKTDEENGNWNIGLGLGIRLKQTK